MKHLLTAIACCLAVAGSAQTWNPDADFDNVIGVNDLMALLSVFGSEWTEEYPQDPEYDMAAYYTGELDLLDCIDTCRVNNAAVISITEYAAFRDSIDFAIGHTASALCALNSGNTSYYNRIWFSTNTPFNYGKIQRGAYGSCTNASVLYNTKLLEVASNSTINDSEHCVCTGLIPAVE